MQRHDSFHLEHCDSLEEIREATPKTLASPGLSAPRTITPTLTLSDRFSELSLVPQLEAENLDIHATHRSDRVPQEGTTKLIQYEDLKRNDLLPKHGLPLSLNHKSILVSRFIRLDPHRLGCLLYMPDCQGRYVPRPVYQSNSRGAWQAPDYIRRYWHREARDWMITYFGKGPSKRGKTETALPPALQQCLSQAYAANTPQDTSEDAKFALVGTASNGFGERIFDQTRQHNCTKLEILYPGSRIDSTGAGWFSAALTPLPPHRFILPDEAMPDFKRPSVMYFTRNGMYGPIRAEVFPSQDDKLLWTYYVQTSTNRAWVAHVHPKDSPLTDTGLPETLVNIGHTISLAPYEYRDELAGTSWCKPVRGIPCYVDIWNKYTVKSPLVQAYYRAKGLPVPH